MTAQICERSHVNLSCQRLDDGRDCKLRSPTESSIGSRLRPHPQYPLLRRTSPRTRRQIMPEKGPTLHTNVIDPPSGASGPSALPALEGQYHVHKSEEGSEQRIACMELETALKGLSGTLAKAMDRPAWGNMIMMLNGLCLMVCRSASGVLADLLKRRASVTPTGPAARHSSC